MIKQARQPKVHFTSLKHGARDEVYYYNLIDYEGNFSDYVNITRHTTLPAAIREAKRFTLDRNWAGPGTNTVYAGMPPRIVRTVRFIELHRAEVEGPLPAMEKAPDGMPVMDKDGGVDFDATCKKTEHEFKNFWGRFTIASKPNVGKSHPALSRLKSDMRRA